AGAAKFAAEISVAGVAGPESAKQRRDLRRLRAGASGATRARLRAPDFAKGAGDAGRAGVDASLFQHPAVLAVAEEIWAHGGEAAVHHDDLARDESGLVGGEEERGVGDVLGHARLGPRLLVPDQPVPRLLALADGERRVDHPRGDRVDPDALARQLRGDGA